VGGSTRLPLSTTAPTGCCGDRGRTVGRADRSVSAGPNDRTTEGPPRFGGSSAAEAAWSGPHLSTGDRQPLPLADPPHAPTGRRGVNASGRQPRAKRARRARLDAPGEPGGSLRGQAKGTVRPPCNYLHGDSRRCVPSGSSHPFGRRAVRSHAASGAHGGVHPRVGALRGAISLFSWHRPVRRLVLGLAEDGLQPPPRVPGVLPWRQYTFGPHRLA